MFNNKWFGRKCRRRWTPLSCLCRNKKLGWSNEWENSIGFSNRDWTFCCRLSIASNTFRVWKKLPSTYRNRVQSPWTMWLLVSTAYSIYAFWIHICVILHAIDVTWTEFHVFSSLNLSNAASYGVEDPEFAITQLAQTTMRSELGKMSLDKVFRERESLNVSIVDSINKAALAWGITCLRYEIRDIKVSYGCDQLPADVELNLLFLFLQLPTRVHEAMQMQVEAERRKRAAILESEGIREADINVAEGKRQSRILASGSFFDRYPGNNSDF